MNDKYAIDIRELVNGYLRPSPRNLRMYRLYAVPGEISVFEIHKYGRRLFKPWLHWHVVDKQRFTGSSHTEIVTRAKRYFVDFVDST